MNLKLIAVGGTVLGTAVGAAAGYFFARKQLEKQFEEELELMTAKMTAHFQTVLKKDLAPKLEQRIPQKPEGVDDRTYENEGPSDEVLERVVEGLRYKPPGVVVAPARKNVFDDAKTVQVESSPKVRKPYQISEEDYHKGERNFAQVELVYYSADDTLADAKDVPLDDVHRITGRDCLEEFDEDGNVYVRNERLQIDYMVTRSAGAYSVEVLGQE